MTAVYESTKNILLTALCLCLSMRPNSAFSTDNLLAGPTVNNIANTLPTITLEEVTIKATRDFKNSQDKLNYERLVYNTKKALHYTKYLLAILNEMKFALLNDIDKSQREETKKTYAIKLKKAIIATCHELTQVQGKICLKLIHRETGKSVYELASELSGKSVALLVQSFVLPLGFNLKVVYDSTIDREIEHIIQRIQDMN